MKRYLFAFLFLFCLNAYAQEYRVTTAIHEVPGRDEATKYRRTDFNGNACALLLLSLDNDNVWFEGDIRHEQFKNGEWWIWIVPGANWLTVLSNDHLPLRVEFAPVTSGMTYEMAIREASELKVLIVVDSLVADYSMTDAVKNKTLDNNGNTCALLRIGLVNTEARFDGNVYKSLYLGGEWWVWLAPGSNSLTVSTPSSEPVTLHFDGVQSAITYLSTLREVTASEKEHLQAEQERLAAQKAEQERLAAERAEQERLAAERAEQERLAAERAEQERLAAAQKAEQERLAAAQKVEQERLAAAQKAEQERLATATRLEEQKADGNKGKANATAALKSALLPGLGQIGKGYAGSGVVTMAGEAVLLGGAAYSYVKLNSMHSDFTAGTPIDGNSRSLYNTYTYAYYGCLGAAAVLYVYNIVRAATMKSRKGRPLTVVPALLPNGETVATGVGLTLNF